ncbi:protein kinase domain-containing protein [Streptomyces sp. NPDC001002]
MQGVLLAERFRIGDRLGAGGMGQVWAALDERMRRDVAVKIVHPQYGMDEAETQARFQREVQLAGRLSHQNIVTVHDWGEVAVDGRRTLFLVMELVHGVPLHRRLAESTPAWPLAVGWVAQIAEALHAAHVEGVVHRDIKPANALLTPSGTVKVVDFGVAKFMGETLGARELTVTGMPLGSPPYMSPEQAEGDRAVDHRSDLYSLGCLLYHAVTGRPPFTGNSQWAVLRKQMDATPEPPASHVQDLPGLLNDLILSLLAKRPEERPDDAAAVCDALCAVLVDEAVWLAGDDTLEMARPVHTASVPGRLLGKVRAAAGALMDDLEVEATMSRRKLEKELDEARHRANMILEESAHRAEMMQIRAEAEAHQLVGEARTAAGEILERARVNERLLWAASSLARTRAAAEQGPASAALVNNANRGRTRYDLGHAARLISRARKEAEETAGKILADARAEAAEIVGEASEAARTTTAEHSPADAVVEGGRIIEAARREAARAAEELMFQARADADEMRETAKRETDQLRAKVQDGAIRLRAETERDITKLRLQAEREARLIRGTAAAEPT